MTESRSMHELQALSLLRASLDVFPDGLAVHRVVRTPAGHVSRFTLELINRAGAAGFTSEPDDLVGVDLFELLGPSCTPMLDAFRRCAETGQTQQFRTTFMESAAAGTTDSIVLRLSDDLLVSTWRDVTEQIVAHELVEEALRRRSDDWQDLKDALDAIDDGVVVLRLQDEGPNGVAPPTDAPPHVLFMNETATSGLGLSDTTVVGRTLDELTDPEVATWLHGLVARAVTAADDARERVVITDAADRVTAAREVTARRMCRNRVLVVSRDISDDA